MGTRVRRVTRTILRSISQYHVSTVPAAAAAANVVRDEVTLTRPGGAGILSTSPERRTLEKTRGGSGWFYAAAGLMAFSTSSVGTASPQTDAEEKGEVSVESEKASSKPRVVFVLGGPGSGKGTQCAKIVDNYGFVHLSAGDLLRAEINSGSDNGNMIQNMIKDGKIVPSEVTVKLLMKAMNESENDKFLIDGFPRNDENRLAFEKVTGLEPEFILYFDCPITELEKRLLGRNEGRVDDNIETIRKRFKVFMESSLPVIEYYDKLGKTRKINATRSRDEVFKTVEPLFKPFLEASACDGLSQKIMQYSSGSSIRD